MSISEIDISDYVSGRLDALDGFRIEAAIASDVLLGRAVERARRVDAAIKVKFGSEGRTGSCRGR